MRRCQTLLAALELADRPEGVTSIQLAIHVRGTRQREHYVWASNKLRRACLEGYLEIVGGQGKDKSPWVYALTETGSKVLAGEPEPDPKWTFEALLKAFGPAPF